MVTMKDIAKELGVSVMTVSRVVNGQYSKVSEDNIIKVKELIKKYNYVPNSTARSLSSNSSRIASLVIRGTGNVLTNPYNAELAGYIADLVQQHDYYLMIHVIDKYDDLTTRLRAWNSEGAIFIGAFDDEIRQIMYDNRIPLIFTDSYTSVRQVNNIGIDDYKGGELAAKHFIENGHQSFAFVGGAFRSNVVQNRLEGFKAEINRSGFDSKDILIIEYEDPMSTVAKQICHHKTPISAVFVTADVMARELMIEVNKLGFSIPGDISFIGFDDLPLSQYTVPPLTTIRQDLARKARSATDALFQQIDDSSHPAANLVLDVTVVERESVRSLDR